MENNRIKLIVTAPYDSKVKQHMNPMFTRTTEESIRAFGAAAASTEHDFHRFAGDFTLWQLGEYYPETGELIPTSRIQIASASEFAKN